MLNLQEINFPSLLGDLAKDLIKNKEGIGFVSFGLGMIMKVAGFDAQLDLLTGKIIFPQAEILKVKFEAEHRINQIQSGGSGPSTTPSAPGISLPGQPVVPFALGSLIPLPPGLGIYPIMPIFPGTPTPQNPANIPQGVLDIAKNADEAIKKIISGFGKVAIADIFILIGFGLMFGDVIVKGLTGVLTALIPKLLPIP